MYHPHFLRLFFLCVQLKHLLEIVLRAVVAFACRKGMVMFKYLSTNTTYVLNVMHYFKAYIFKELSALRSLGTE